LPAVIDVYEVVSTPTKKATLKIASVKEFSKKILIKTS
jgi:hypothetical protein